MNKCIILNKDFESENLEVEFIPKGSILTPHPKEFERIAGKTSNSFERLELQKDLSIKFGVYIVLKGAHTSISCPDGRKKETNHRCRRSSSRQSKCNHCGPPRPHAIARRMVP